MKKLCMLIAGSFAIAWAPDHTTEGKEQGSKTYHLLVTNIQGTKQYNEYHPTRQELIAGVNKLLGNPEPKTIPSDPETLAKNRKLVLCGEQLLPRYIYDEKFREVRLPDTPTIILTEVLQPVSSDFFVRHSLLARGLENKGNPELFLIPDCDSIPVHLVEMHYEQAIKYVDGREMAISVFVQTDETGRVIEQGRAILSKEFLDNLLDREIFNQFKELMMRFNSINMGEVFLMHYGARFKYNPRYDLLTPEQRETLEDLGVDLTV